MTRSRFASFCEQATKAFGSVLNLSMRLTMKRNDEAPERAQCGCLTTSTRRHLTIVSICPSLQFNIFPGSHFLIIKAIEMSGRSPNHFFQRIEWLPVDYKIRKYPTPTIPYLIQFQQSIIVHRSLPQILTGCFTPAYEPFTALHLKYQTLGCFSKHDSQVFATDWKKSAQNLEVPQNTCEVFGTLSEKFGATVFFGVSEMSRTCVSSVFCRCITINTTC